MEIAITVIKRATHEKASLMAKKLVIGIDVGGTKIEAVLFDGKKILSSTRVPTQADKPYKTVFANIVAAARMVHKPGVVAIGLATPGYVKNGILYATPNNPSLKVKPLAHDLSKALKLPVVHENDAKLFACAEKYLGTGRGKKNIIGVVIGTGIGAGIIADGTILRGAIGAAGEIGHAPYLEKEYEYYVSGPGITRLYKERSGKNASAGEVLRERKDKTMLAVQNEVYEHLGRLLATLINIFNPEVIVIGGGVSKSIEYQRLRTVTKKYALPASYKSVTIAKHAISDSAGSIGAAILALEYTNK